MRNILTIAIIALIAITGLFAQTPRKPINISNDFYTIKIEEGVGIVGHDILTSTSESVKMIKIKNAPFKLMLSKVLPNKNVIFRDPSIEKLVVSFELLFPEISYKEASQLFWQQLVKFYALKAVEKKVVSENWSLLLEDSLKLKKAQYLKEPVKINGAIRGITEADSADVWRISNTTLDAFANRLSEKTAIHIFNAINSDKKYEFEFILKQPIDNEAIIKKLATIYGIKVEALKDEKEVVELDIQK